MYARGRRASPSLARSKPFYPLTIDCAAPKLIDLAQLTEADSSGVLRGRRSFDRNDVAYLRNVAWRWVIGIRVKHVWVEAAGD